MHDACTIFRTWICCCLVYMLYHDVFNHSCWFEIGRLLCEIHSSIFLSFSWWIPFFLMTWSELIKTIIYSSLVNYARISPHFFLQTKAYIISLFSNGVIQIGNVSKIQRQNHEMAALTRVWATMFACRFTNLTMKFWLQDRILLILLTRKLNSE
jgi:hypothetical protein